MLPKEELKFQALVECDQGQTYIDQGKYFEAQTVLSDAERIFSTLPTELSQKFVPVVCGALGILYEAVDNPTTANEYHVRSMKNSPGIGTASTFSTLHFIYFLFQFLLNFPQSCGNTPTLALHCTLPKLSSTKPLNNQKVNFLKLTNPQNKKK